MLGSYRLTAFLPTADSEKARAFYESILGLKTLSDDPFALVMDAAGIQLRITKVKDFKPQSFTVLGWEVPDIEKSTAALREKGIRFEFYGFEGQAKTGIWSAPGGAKVAWFKDPDGNILSITQHSS